jgi:hypothetical protein
VFKAASNLSRFLLCLNNPLWGKVNHGHLKVKQGNKYPQGNAGSGQNLSGFSQTVINATGMALTCRVFGQVVSLVGHSVFHF